MGLLLMRLAAGFTLVDHGIVGLCTDPPLGQAIVYGLKTVVGTLLVAGLWTPVAGVLAAAVELWRVFEQPRHSSTHILLATLAAASALVGPGAWSVDARLFGWKRIDIRNKRS